MTGCTKSSIFTEKLFSKSKEVTFHSVNSHGFAAGLQDFSLFHDFMYQNGGKYTKLPLNFQTAIKYTKWP
jgi:hypothetical protein